MLNPYFSFGVPSLLLLLYVAFAFFQRSAHIPYLGFVLFIIAGFMAGFSLQVMQLAWNEIQQTSIEHVQEVIHYAPYLLVIPFLIAMGLIVFHLYQGYVSIRTLRLKTKK